MPCEYICGDCKKSFPTPSKLAAHQDRKFPCSAGGYGCTKCNATFTRRNARDRHRQRCQGLPETIKQLQEERDVMRGLLAQTAPSETAPSQLAPSQLAPSCYSETLVGESLLQEVAVPPVTSSSFLNAVSVAKFCEPDSFLVESETDVREYRAPQFYLRQVFGKWSNVHPVGRPQDVLSAEQLAKFAVIKIGSQGDTNRQMTHGKQYDRSELIDSCLTTSYKHVESKAKDLWRDHCELYEGLHEDKRVRDTELLLVRDQEDYKRYLAVVQQLCERFPYIPDKPDKPMEDSPIELRLAQEQSKQMEAEARKAEAEANARRAEADARKAEVKLEILKLKMLNIQAA